MGRPIISATWSDVVMANYRLPADLLAPFVPAGCELDTPSGSPDLHLVSLVAFNFRDLRVFGLPALTTRHFAEMNLRFYVRHQQQRGVAFLREFVPSPLVAQIARTVYHEPYQVARLSHTTRAEPGRVHLLTCFANAAQAGEIRVVARAEPFFPAADSLESFLKEHYWGYNRAGTGRGLYYRVTHPVWRVLPVERFEVTVDPAAILGGRFREVVWPAALHSVLVAEGSPVSVSAAIPWRFG